MLNNKKLPPLLEEINALIQALHSLKEGQSLTTVSNQLRERIINSIKEEFLKPPSGQDSEASLVSEDSETSLIIVSLGKILKTLEEIKPIIEPQSHSFQFFKPNPSYLPYKAAQKLDSQMNELIKARNQLEQLLGNQIYMEGLRSSSPAPGG